MPEVCDGLDNDCNGKVDDANGLCPEGEMCAEGRCQLSPGRDAGAPGSMSQELAPDEGCSCGVTVRRSSLALLCCLVLLIGGCSRWRRSGGY